MRKVLLRPLETAKGSWTKIVRSRGQFLPFPAFPIQALPALETWLDPSPKDVLAIGPLTNLALAYRAPEKLQRLVSNLDGGQSFQKAPYRAR